MLHQPLSQAGHNFLGHARPFVNQAGVKLHERCAGGDFLPGVIRVENAAHADDRQRASGPAIQVPDDFGAARAQRPAAESACLGVNAFQPGIIRVRPCEGRVRRDNARDLPRPDQFQNFIQRLEGKVGGNFHQDRFVVRGPWSVVGSH